ncbi:MAG: oxidoreductase [Alphaproteobacteria bacterium]|nr:MAG: oxidoreductase [Alphaproteobacteria bacterium]
MGKRFNVAIIGAGIGGEHLDGFLELEDKYRVTVICDLDMGRAAELAKHRDYIRGESDFQRVLNDPTIDVIDICLPPDLHLSASLKAMEAQKHVICEKPLVGSLADADKLLKRFNEVGGCYSPVFQYRYGLAMAQLNALTAAGLTGKPYLATLETHWNRGSGYYSTPWRSTWEKSRGGAVLSHAIHIHDILCQILGDVAKVSAFSTTRVNDIEVEDCAALSFQMKNGAVATSSITLGAANDTSRLRIVYEGLTAQSSDDPYAPLEGGWTFAARDPYLQSDIDNILAKTQVPLSGYVGFFADFYDALMGQPNNAVTLADGRRSLELVSAIYHANTTGSIVDLPLSDTHSNYKNWLP